MVFEMLFLTCCCRNLICTLCLCRNHNLSIHFLMFQVFEISPSLYVVELRKSYGDSSAYRQACLSLPPSLPSLYPFVMILLTLDLHMLLFLQLCTKLSNDLGVPSSPGLLTTEVWLFAFAWSTWPSIINGSNTQHNAWVRSAGRFCCEASRNIQKLGCL